MLATEAIASDVQLRVPSAATPSNRNTRLEHQDTVTVTDENASPTHDVYTSSVAVMPPLPSPRASISNKSFNITATITDSPDTGNSNNPSTSHIVEQPSHQQRNYKLTNSSPKSSTSASISAGVNKPSAKDKVKYGELVVLGYNGSLIGGDNGRKKSKFSLYRKSVADGVKPSNKQFVSKPRDPKVTGDGSVHSVSYTLSRTQAVIVEYEKDESTDMFQIGRSSESAIDFVVTDTVPGHQRSSSAQIPQSTISRFSCRICVEREPPYTARIYAAGFDQHNHIFLGEKASKWNTQTNEMDGLTTNGILIIHPRGSFSDKQCQPGIWREVSVRGGIYSLRETRSVPSKSQKVDNECNILLDGTLIDLCGATLVWRSSTGLECSPTNKSLEEYIELINASRPQCPVGLNTLVLPKRNAKIERSKQPYVYLSCGHVHGEHDWKKEDDTANRTCPMCFKEGSFVRVQIGVEASLYTDNEPLTHAFIPCAHMTSENTARYWSSVVIPYGCQGFRAMCPFCATPLAGSGSNGYIKLIFQDNTEF